MIASAQHHVFLQSPFFIPRRHPRRSAAHGCPGDVDVRVMLSSRPSGNPLPDWASNTYMADVVAAGVRVFRYEKGYLHAKTLSVDSKVCSIGSANIDIRSFSINYELNAVLYSERLASELEADFERDPGDCSEFALAGYQKRHPAARFRDSVARLLSLLL